jgi:two-component system, LytTR family, sensor kinase
MPAHGNLRDPILINTIGHTAGVLLFGLFIVLLLRDWRSHGIRQINLSLIAALLALGWNIGSLVALGSSNPRSLPIEIVVTVSFSVLSLLPAVLFQVALQGQHRLVVAAGYAVSLLAVTLQVSGLFSPSLGLHQAALGSIVVGFGVLTITAFLIRHRRSTDRLTQRSDWISLGCLVLFTSSFLHFGYQHVDSPWAAEIAWHHLGIPVALIVLLQDYRLLLLDTFTRFLVNFGLAAVYIAAVLALNQRFQLWGLTAPGMFRTGIVLVALCLSLILFAHLRNALQAWVNRVLFRRQSVDDCVKTIASLASSARSEEELLAQAGKEVARHLRTDRFAVLAGPTNSENFAKPSVVFHEEDLEGFPRESFHAEAQIPLRFSSGDSRLLVVGARRGGRRYFTEDLADMQRLGSAVVEQIERFRAEELKRLATQAELRALQAQINPHFLFNALNTLYGTIDRRSHEARRLVLNLADIFRYFLQGDRTVIPLSEELRIIEAYLEIEALRLGDRLRTELVVDESTQSVLIPILSVQPLVENAVKHGIAAKAGPGRVCVRAHKVPTGMRITVEDSGVGFEHSRRHQPGGGAGLGLENVRKRLRLCYGAAADLEIRSTNAGTNVSFLIPDVPCAEPISSQVEVEA